MTTEYTFRIDGSYRPDTIPLERLGDYLAALGQLFGEQAQVHFSKLTKGSTVVHATVEHSAVPKVERRVQRVAIGEGTGKATKAYERLDDLLREDNATGQLSGGRNNVIHIDFQGCKRAERVLYGPIKQVGIIDGEVFRIEGRDATVHVGVMDGVRTYSLEAPAAMGKELAPLFRSGIVRFRGEGTWFRHGPGNRELRRFKIDGFERLDQAPLSDAINQLRQAGIGEWADLKDPIGQLLNERQDGEIEH